MGRRFVSAGWPYLYDVPGLHNCVPMLFADVVARHGRLRGDDVTYLCGSDDHGSRIEFVSEGYHIAPEALIAEKRRITVPLLERMGLSLDRFGRTSEPAHKAYVAEMFTRLRERGAIAEREVMVPWCDACRRFLPDRFVEGSCPHCGGRAYGNQCEAKRGCDRLLRPEELKDPRCALCRAPTSLRPAGHWVFDLARYAERASAGVSSSPTYRDEVARVVAETIKNVPEVVVTRDVRWGIPLPWDVGEGKTVYNWVDSLLAKVSHARLDGAAREDQLWRDPDTRKIFFLGRDGVSFYAVLFPALLEAAGLGYHLGNWWVIPNEVFIYEGGVCSKSTGTGIWLAEALDTLPGDFWRFYVLYAYARRKPGDRDVDFRWDRFCGSLSTDLIGPLETALARARGQEPGADRVVSEIEDAMSKAGALLDEVRIGAAFSLVIDGLHALAAASPPASSAAVLAALRRLLPLLGCYVPEAAGRALAILDGKRPDPLLFPGGAPKHREVQRAYQKRVEERRARRTLEEDVTDARADALCVCPIDLGER